MLTNDMSHKTERPNRPSIANSGPGWVNGPAAVLAVPQAHALPRAQVWAGGEQPPNVHHVVAGQHQLNGAANKVAQAHAQEALVGPA